MSSLRAQKIHNPIKGITNNAVHRMARQAGIKSISSESIEEVRNLIKKVLEEIIMVAVAVLQHNRKKKITSKDIKKGIYAVTGRKFVFDDEQNIIKNCKHRETVKSVEPSEGKKRKFKPGTVALREIRHYQKASDCVLIAKAPFKRLVYSITIDFIDADRFKYSKPALVALQMFIENYFVDFLDSTHIITLYCDRLRVDVSDMKLAEKICMNMSCVV